MSMLNYTWCGEAPLLDPKTEADGAMQRYTVDAVSDWPIQSWCRVVSTVMVPQSSRLLKLCNQFQDGAVHTDDEKDDTDDESIDETVSWSSLALSSTAS